MFSNFSSCSYRFVTAYHHDPSCCANVDDKVIQIEYPMGAEEIVIAWQRALSRSTDQQAFAN